MSNGANEVRSLLVSHGEVLSLVDPVNYNSLSKKYSSPHVSAFPKRDTAKDLEYLQRILKI